MVGKSAGSEGDVMLRSNIFRLLASAVLLLCALMASTPGYAAVDQQISVAGKKT
jgi:hypothetical protein